MRERCRRVLSRCAQARRGRPGRRAAGHASRPSRAAPGPSGGSARGHYRRRGHGLCSRSRGRARSRSRARGGPDPLWRANSGGLGVRVIAVEVRVDGIDARGPVVGLATRMAWHTRRVWPWKSLPSRSSWNRNRIGNARCRVRPVTNWSSPTPRENRLHGARCGRWPGPWTVARSASQGMQFEFAWEKAKNPWLHIVESAGSAQANIVRIRDPAGQARTFTFDHGWRAVAVPVGGDAKLPSERVRTRCRVSRTPGFSLPSFGWLN